MSRSSLISQPELRQILRLIGECRELGDDPVVWRQHLLGGLAKLVDADVVMNAEVAGILRDSMLIAGGTAWGLDQGFNPEGYMELGKMFTENQTASAIWCAQVAAVRAQPEAGVTAARQNVVDDRAWYRSFDYERIARVIGTDATMFSLLATPGNDKFDGLNLTRARGRRKFQAREVMFVRLVHTEIARLTGGPLTSFSEPSPSSLSPRGRQVLRFLLEGDHDKQIAERLHLSQHTVNQYTKQIYKFFRVNSRTELLARWLRRGWSSQALWNNTTEFAKWESPS